MVKKIVRYVDRVGENDPVEISTTWYLFGIPIWNRVNSYTLSIWCDLKDGICLS